MRRCATAILVIWKGHFEIQTNRDPSRLREVGFRIGIYATAALNAELLAFDGASPTMRSNCSHLPTTVARYQRSFTTSTLADGKSTEREHDRSKVRFREKTSNNFSGIPAQISTLRQHALHQQLEKREYNDTTVAELRERVFVSKVRQRERVSALIAHTLTPHRARRLQPPPRYAASALSRAPHARPPLARTLPVRPALPWSKEIRGEGKVRRRSLAHPPGGDVGTHG